MRRILVFSACLAVSAVASAQQCNCSTDVGGFGGGSYVGGMGGYGGFGGGGGSGQSQLYPYDQQDTWLHGQYQRVPSYGGYNSFRPYNYRHVASQGQIAANWGVGNGMPYSQQFWNRYRPSYLNQNLHSQYDSTSSGLAVPQEFATVPASGLNRTGSSPNPYATVSHQTPERLVMPAGSIPVQPNQAVSQPLHVFPVGAFGR